MPPSTSVYDPNKWYSIIWPDNGAEMITSWIHSGDVHSGTSSHFPWASVYLQSPSNSSGDHYGLWQFMPVGSPSSSQYIIRPGMVNASWAMSVSELQIIQNGACGDNCTQPELIVAPTPDASALWTVTPDGNNSTAQLSNKANGTLHAYVRDDGGEGSGQWCFMGGYLTAQSAQMTFQIQAVKAINDPTYSTLPPALAQVASQATAGPTAPPTSNSQGNNSHPNADGNNRNNNGPSSSSSSKPPPSGGAIAGIVIAAVAFLLILIALTLYVRHLRKKSKTVPSTHEQQALTTPTGEPSSYAAEKVGPHGVNTDLEGLAEAPADNALHEAPRDAETGLAGDATHAANKRDVYEMDASGEGGQEKGRGWVFR